MFRVTGPVTGRQSPWPGEATQERPKRSRSERGPGRTGISRRALPARADDVLGAEDRELLRHRRLVEVEDRLQLPHATLADAQELEDPDADRMREGLEELGLEGLQLRGRRRRGHEDFLYQNISISSSYRATRGTPRWSASWTRRA